MALALWVSWAAQQVELLDPLKVNGSKPIDLLVDLPNSEPRVVSKLRASGPYVNLGFAIKCVRILKTIPIMEHTHVALGRV